MTSETLLLAAGALAAALVSGASGFGFALVATALWSHGLEPRVVTVLALVFSLLLNVGYLPLFWRQVPLRRFAPFAVSGVIGVPLGAWVLGTLPAAQVRTGLGTLLLVYGAAMLMRSRPHVLALAPRAALAGDAAVGFAGGVLGGLAGLSGFLPALWCTLRGWDKSTSRGLMQAYILLTGVFGIFWVGRFVGIDEGTRGHLLLGLPFVVAGGVLGLALYSRLDTARFNRMVLWLLATCGALLLVRG